MFAFAQQGLLLDWMVGWLILMLDLSDRSARLRSMIKLHSVNHSGSRSNRYCGPSVLSILAGISTGDAATLLRKVGGRKSIKGTYTSEMRTALLQLGYSMHTWFDYDGLPAKGRPTLLQWAKKRAPGGDTYLLSVGNHWAVVQGRRYACGMVGKVIGLRQSPKKRARVRAVWRIVHENRVKLAEVIPMAKRPIDTQRKPRTEAKALAAQYDINVERDGPFNDMFWVYPPDKVDGRPFSDPRVDEHSAYDWAEVLVIVKEYVEAIDTFKAQPSQIKA